MILIQEIEKTFPNIERFFTDQELYAFQHCSYHELELYDIGLGSLVETQLLQADKELMGTFAAYQIDQLQDMKRMILRLFWLHLQEREDTLF